MTNSKDACFLEEFLCDHEFPPAVYDEIHALNGRWRNNHKVTDCNEFNRTLLFSALDIDLVNFLESKKIKILIKKKNDWVITYYRFEDHNFVVEDNGIVVDVMNENLNPDYFISLLISIMNFFNGG